MIVRRWIFVLFAWMVIYFFQVDDVRAAAMRGDNVRIENQAFGLHVRFTHRQAPGRPHYSVWPWIKFGSLRTWNSYTSWMDIETRRGQFNFVDMDAIVSAAESEQTDIIVTLGRTPRWASSRPNEDCGISMGCAAEPIDIELWANYVASVVSRYKGRVRAYEIWNEPAFSEIENVVRPSGRAIQYYTGSAQKMVLLSKVAYGLIKSLDPGALVVSPSVTSEGGGVRRLEEFIKYGGGAFVDVWGYHFYLNKPEDFVGEYHQLMGMLKKWSLHNKPLWNTETGYVIGDIDGVILDSRFERRGWSAPKSQRLVGAYLARSYVLQLSYGVKRIFWFNWDHSLPEGPMGLASDGLRLNDVGYAYARVRSWMIGAVALGCSNSLDKVWRCEFTRDDARFAIVWSDAGTLSIPIRGSRFSEELYGLKRPVGSQSLFIGEEPVLITN